MKNNHFSITVSVATLLVFVIAAVAFVDTFDIEIKSTKLPGFTQNFAVTGAILLVLLCIALIANFIFKLISICRFKKETVVEYKMNMVNYFRHYRDQHSCYFESDWSFPESACFKLSRYLPLATIIAPIILVNVLALFYVDIAIYGLVAILSIVLLYILFHIVHDQVMMHEYRKVGVAPVKFKIVDDGIVLLPKNKILKFAQIDSIIFRDYEHFGLASDCIYYSFRIDIKSAGKTYSFSKTESAMNPFLLTYLKDYLANIGFIENDRLDCRASSHSTIFKYS